MIIKLNAREQRFFVEKILNPPAPCKKLLEAARKWGKLPTKSVDNYYTSPVARVNQTLCQHDYHKAD